MEEIAAFGVLGSRLGLQLHYADVRVMAGLSARLAPLGVTPARATAIVYIGLHPGCDQTTLGRALGVNRASTVKAVDEMETLGAIERRPGRDRRTNALHLTAAGEALRARIEQETAVHDQQAFMALTPAERDQLSQLLAKLR
ncbi:MarR family transcriptional regulator [Caulobacter segnis]|uniref:MarR family winged helix-turn-helix transcriptional regulator n=1 Tax=Caulobacter segnis TaxID=88688 RepID=UPI00285E2B37|nr:MarR family transcriptional regulator [Caulobacter segnis]MDR6625295.1 DNA-binding MarR family transcriptional regulator [Caulobacter segnis]